MARKNYLMRAPKPLTQAAFAGHPNLMSQDKDFKARVKTAIDNYIIKQDKKTSGPKRRNEKPEKLVEHACLEWMRNKGWSVQIIESKSTFDPKRQRYISQTTKAGTCDCFGVTDDGYAVFVEFKAQGKRNTFALDKNFRQAEYLTSKIRTGAFACVVDSPQLLEETYTNWVNLKSLEGLKPAIEFLLNQLPRQNKKNPTSDQGEMGF